MKRAFYIQFVPFILFFGCSADIFEAGDADPSPDADAASSLDAASPLDAEAGSLDGSTDPDVSGESDVKLDAPAEGASPTSRRIFVTSKTMTPDFGGLSQGDAICQNAAQGAGLGGTWMAWLSTGQTSAASRLEHATVPYKLVTGTTVASDWTVLTGGTLAHAIDRDETGALDATATVATGTTASGGSASGNCNGWTSKTSSFSEAAGETTAQATDSSWTDAFSYVCSGATLVSLYCVEQGS